METIEEKAKTFGGDRRSFLRNAGVGALAAAFIMSCKKKKDDPTPEVTPIPTPNDPNPPGSGATVELGSGNAGILNYAYALEQLEAAFYTRVVTGSLTGTTPSSEFTSTFPNATEQTLMKDLMAHEVAHRDFFKTALTALGTNVPIKGLTPYFKTIDFSNRASVLGAAKTFEDLGVAAYNGAGKLIDVSNAAGVTYLGLAGKIVSVEARHASAIRDLVAPNSFSLTADSNGLDPAMAPSAVLAAAQNYVVDKINGSNLPTA